MFLSCFFSFGTRNSCSDSRFTWVNFGICYRISDWRSGRLLLSRLFGFRTRNSRSDSRFTWVNFGICYLINDWRRCRLLLSGFFSFRTRNSCGDGIFTGIIRCCYINSFCLCIGQLFSLFSSSLGFTSFASGDYCTIVWEFTGNNLNGFCCQRLFGFDSC